jgi:hypothetical protein
MADRRGEHEAAGSGAQRLCAPPVGQDLTEMRTDRLGGKGLRVSGSKAESPLPISGVKVRAIL